MATSIYSDLHLFPHSWKAHILPSGRNSRLQNGVDAAMQVVNGSGRGDTVFFAGDWHESQTEVPLEALDATKEIVDAMISKDLTVYFLVGNHDQLSRDGMVHSLGLLHRPKDKLFVVDKPAIIDGWAFLPFRRPVDLPAALDTLNALYEEEHGKKRKKMPLLCHVDMIGGVSNSGHLSSKGLRLSDFPSWASVIVSGHYHRNQTMGDRFMFVGSPYQQSAGEAGEVKVWLKCDGVPSSLDDFTKVEFEGLPRFVELSAPAWEGLTEEDKQEVVERDFVTVVTPHDKRLTNLPNGVSQKPLPKTTHKLATPVAASTTVGALQEWLIRRGRPDLNEQALAFL